jgi:hypothetical protein
MASVEPGYLLFFPFSLIVLDEFVDVMIILIYIIVQTLASSNLVLRTITMTPVNPHTLENFQVLLSRTVHALNCSANHQTAG